MSDMTTFELKKWPGTLPIRQDNPIELKNPKDESLKIASTVSTSKGNPVNLSFVKPSQDQWLSSYRSDSISKAAELYKSILELLNRELKVKGPLSYGGNWISISEADYGRYLGTENIRLQNLERLANIAQAVKPTFVVWG